MAIGEAPEARGGGGVEAYDYQESPDAPFIPAWNGWEMAPDAAEECAQVAPRAKAPEAIDATDLERRLAEEARRSFEAGRARGVEEGRRQEREEGASIQAAAEEKRVAKAAELLEHFARERDGYFSQAEQDVVKLALAVAARILRREAQMDPLLLMGAVRVALGQLSASTEVRLYVPATEIELWTEAVALVPNLAVKPQILAGEGMRRGDCRIETTLGSADLGIRAQLGEIEAGFTEQSGGAERKEASTAAQREAQP